MTRPRFFRLGTLPFSAFLATTLLYPPNFAVFHDLLSSSQLFVVYSIYSMLAASVAVGAGMVVVCARRGGGLFVRASSVIAGATCQLAGFVLLVASFGVGGTGGTALVVVGGVLLGAGSVELCVAWGAHLAAYDLRQALFACAVSVGLGTLLRLLMASVSDAAGIVVFALLAVVGAVAPCRFAVRGALDASEEGVSATTDAEVERLTGSDAGKKAASGSMSSFASSVKRMAQVAGLAFVGLLVFSFSTGFSRLYLFGGIRIEFVCDLIAAVCVLPLALAKSDRPLMPLIYQVILPAFALVLMVLNVFPAESAPKAIGLMGAYVLLSAVDVLALASLTAMAHAREFSPVLIASATTACFSAAGIVGFLCGTTTSLGGDNSSFTSLLVCTLYFALILLVLVARSWRREEPRPQPTLGVELAQRCDQVAKAGKLTPRETEVLAYLGRGYGITYTANVLVISESTVRTHVRNIYHKLGVSSREELLQLIDEAG